MPTVFREEPYRVFFFSHETTEPPHVHVDRDDLSAKFWLEPFALAANFGFSSLTRSGLRLAGLSLFVRLVFRRGR